MLNGVFFTNSICFGLRKKMRCHHYQELQHAKTFFVGWLWMDYALLCCTSLLSLSLSLSLGQQLMMVRAGHNDLRTSSNDLRTLSNDLVLGPCFPDLRWHWTRLVELPVMMALDHVRTTHKLPCPMR